MGRLSEELREWLSLLLSNTALIAQEVRGMHVTCVGEQLGLSGEQLKVEVHLVVCGQLTVVRLNFWRAICLSRSMRVRAIGLLNWGGD